MLQLAHFHSEILEEMQSLNWITIKQQEIDGIIKYEITNEEILDSGEMELYLDYVVLPLRLLYSWAIPNENVLNAIEKVYNDHQCHGILEIGAGTGYWAKLLKERGLNICAFDRCPCYAGDHAGIINDQHCINMDVDMPPFHFKYQGNAPAFFGVEADIRAECELQDMLLLCWPPKEDIDIEENLDDTHPDAKTRQNLMGYNAIRAFSGDFVVYVGERRENLCAKHRDIPDTGGTMMMQALTDSFQIIQTVTIPNWPFQFGDMTIWKRKKEAEDTLCVNKNNSNNRNISNQCALQNEDHEEIRRQIVFLHRCLWEDQFVLKKIAGELNQGIVNVATRWLEYAVNMENRTEQVELVKSKLKQRERKRKNPDQG